jgi:hypothetical protein
MSEKSNLQKAIDLMEENGFKVSRAHLENNKDAGNNDEYQSSLTGAIILRITPKAA